LRERRLKGASEKLTAKIKPIVEGSFLATDRLVLIDFQDEIYKLLSFLENHGEPTFWAWLVERRKVDHPETY